MYTEVTRSLVELSQDGDEGSEEKNQTAGIRLILGSTGCICVRARMCVRFACAHVVGVCVSLLQQDPQIKTAKPTLPPHASLFLSPSLSFSVSPPPLSLKTAGPGF